MKANKKVPDRKTPGSGDPWGFNPAKNGLGLGQANPSILPGISPPAGLTSGDLRFLVFQVVMEKLGWLQEQSGLLIEQHPSCPRGVSLRVDGLTVQMDATQASLGQRQGLAEGAA